MDNNQMFLYAAKKFDWKEHDEAKAWVRERLKKGVRVFMDNNGMDSFPIYCGKDQASVLEMTKSHKDGYGEIEQLVELFSDDDMDFIVY